MSVRVAMIGAGQMANNVHYPSLASFDDVEIAAICDVDPARLNATADKYGVERRYSDYRRMIEELTPGVTFFALHPNAPGDIEVIKPDLAHCRTDEHRLAADPGFAAFIAEQGVVTMGFTPLLELLRNRAPQA